MKKITYFLLTLLILISAGVHAQDEEETKRSKPERKAFESAVLIDNQSDVVNSSKTLEWNIQHRFGTIENGSSVRRNSMDCRRRSGACRFSRR